MTPPRCICLDTETTGLSAEFDRVCEIAAVAFDPVSFETGERFHAYVNPERNVPYGAYRVHGLSTDFLRTKPVFAEVADEFLAFVAGARIYIHNAAYDRKMLDAELARLDRPLLSACCTGIHCTLKTARQFRGRSGNRLDNLCDAYGIDRSNRSYHGAMLDCELLLQVMARMEGAGARFEGLPR